MSIATPIDVTTPATQRRQLLAKSLQQQYNKAKSGTKAAQGFNAAAVHAMPLFGGAGARDSATLPSAPQPQLTVPFMQDPGVMSRLGIVNPAAPQANTVSQGPGQGAPGFGNPDMPQGANPGLPTNMMTNLGVTQSVDPGQPQAGQGTYADGSPGPQPIVDPNLLLRNFGSMAGVRRLYGGSGASPSGSRDYIS